MATFNILHGRSAAGGVDVGRLRLACASLGADVLALQEVDRHSIRSHRADLAAEVADACGMDHVFAPTRRTGWLGRYGNALLARGAIEDHRALALPRVERHEPRNAVLATVAVRGRRFSVAATHLSTHRDEARAQLDAVVAELVALPAPHVLLGDFNLDPQDLGPVGRAGLAVAGGAPTFPAKAPSRRIDHVAAAGFDVDDVRVVAAAVSDHRALVVRLS